MPDQRISARRWARAFGGKSPVNAALAATFEHISNGTYDCALAAHACPLVDMSLGGKAYSKPRLPFLITEVVDGSAHVGDEFAHVNSCCRSHPQYDRPEEGEETHAQSSHRVPDPQFDSKLGFQPGQVPPEQRILVEACRPAVPVTMLHQSAAKIRAQKSGVPQSFCRRTQYHLRQRQLKTEACIQQAMAEKAHISSATAEIPEVHSDQLSPEQTQELQSLIEKYKDQISWDPNDIGCLSDEYKEFYLTIPTVEGASCKQRPYKLSYRELETFKSKLVWTSHKE